MQRTVPMGLLSIPARVGHDAAISEGALCCLARGNASAPVNDAQCVVHGIPQLEDNRWAPPWPIFAGVAMASTRVMPRGESVIGVDEEQAQVALAIAGALDVPVGVFPGTAFGKLAPGDLVCALPERGRFCAANCREVRARCRSAPVPFGTALTVGGVRNGYTVARVAHVLVGAVPRWEH
jgi:hypothetical protein